MTTYDKNNVFARILRGELPCKKVFENEYVLAFHDLFPAAPVHVLVIPKGSFVSFDDFIGNAKVEMVTEFFKAVKEVTALMEVRNGGYRLISNHGSDGGQTVPHFHMHILGKKPLGALVG